MKMISMKTKQEKHRKHSLTVLRMKFRLCKLIFKNFSSEDLVHPVWMKVLMKLKEAVFHRQRQ